MVPAWALARLPAGLSTLTGRAERQHMDSLTRSNRPGKGGPLFPRADLAGDGAPTNGTLHRPLSEFPTTEATAIALLGRGFWPVLLLPLGAPKSDGKPAEGKEPFLQRWGLDRLTPGRLKSTLRRQPKAGVGICLGPGRAPGGRWLADLEGDGPEAEESRAALFGGELVETLGWSSVRGHHQLLSIDPDRLLPILARIKGFEVERAGQPGVYHLVELPGLELRFGGFSADGTTVKQLQSACPPTPGTDGTPRAWNGVETVAEAPESFYAALEALAPKVVEPEPTPESNGHANGFSVPNDPRKLTATSGNRPDDVARAIAYLQKIDPAISGQGGSKPTFRAACAIGWGFDLDEETTFRLIRDHYSPRCVPPWSDEEIRHKVQDAFKASHNKPRGHLRDADRADYRGNKARTSSNGDGTAPEQRPAIEISTRRHEALAATMGVLRADPDLYRRGDLLVTVDTEAEDEIALTARSTIRNTAGAPKVTPLSAHVIGCRLPALAEFYQWRKTKSGEDVAVDAHPPAWLVQAIHTRGHYPGVRPLLSVVECPYPRPDGSLVETPGYDPATGTLYRPSMEFPPVPERPTKEDAREAAERIQAFVHQFPFRSDADKAVWLAGMLTTVGRPAIDGPVPGVAVRGNVAGAGKGLLIDLISIVAVGRPAPTTSYPDNKEEAAKVKTSIALSGRPLVHFDNLDEGSFYGNSALDSALTSNEVNDRILGQSKETGALPLRVSWFLSGNNVSPGKDAHRRWLPCNLLSQLERPEEREDIEQKDLRSHVAENRGELVRDCLTILRAHAQAGRPAASKAPLGSFERWDEVVRGAVLFATGIDPCQTRREAAEDSPERQLKLALLEAWKDLPGGGDKQGGISVDEALRLAEERIDDSRPNAPFARPVLRSALLATSRDGKLPTIRSLGNRIRAMAGANLDGMRFEKVKEVHRVALWAVTTVNPPSPEPRGACESTSPNESDSDPTRTEDPPCSYSDVGDNGKAYGGGGKAESSRLVDSHADGAGRRRGVL